MEKSLRYNKPNLARYNVVKNTKQYKKNKNNNNNNNNERRK